MNGRGNPEEALSVFLGSRRKARSLLARTTLRHLADCDESELARFIPREQARQFAAALCLAHEVISPPPRMRLDTPSDAYAHLYPYLAGREAERFVVAACDIRRSVVATAVVAEGTAGSVSVHPADIFAVAVRHRAVAVIVAHNHPSGITKPSPEDHELTGDLRDAGELLGIPVIDHLVVAGDRFWSIASGGETRVRIVRATRRRR